MRPPHSPIFLARRAYRQRRIADAARLLPFVGAFLLVVPVFWRPAATGTADTVPAAVYLFAVWALLIAGAALLARRLGHEESDARDTDRDAP